MLKVHTNLHNMMSNEWTAQIIILIIQDAIYKCVTCTIIIGGTISDLQSANCYIIGAQTIPMLNMSFNESNITCNPLFY